MTSKKLTNVLKIITDSFMQEHIPYSLIGALALSSYGLPRFTADIDLLTEARFWIMMKNQQSIKEERKIIFEMIDASWELAQRLGEHPVKTGCNCISCLNKRKRILKKQKMKWKFNL